MGAHCQYLEIVSVATNACLFDDESYQRQYTLRDGSGLKPGMYVVSWPAGVGQRRYDEHAIFHGPYCSREEACVAFERIQFVGVWEATACASAPPTK